MKLSIKTTQLMNTLRFVNVRINICNAHSTYIHVQPLYNSYLIFTGLYFKTFNTEYVINKLEIINSHVQIYH